MTATPDLATINDDTFALSMEHSKPNINPQPASEGIDSEMPDDDPDDCEPTLRSDNEKKPMLPKGVEKRKSSKNPVVFNIAKDQAFNTSEAHSSEDDLEEKSPHSSLKKKSTLARRKSFQRSRTQSIHEELRSNLQKSSIDPSKQKTIKELKDETKNVTPEMQLEHTVKLVSDLEEKHQDYFKGKKIMFDKNQSCKQCVLNPYTGNQSVITL